MLISIATVVYLAVAKWLSVNPQVCIAFHRGRDAVSKFFESPENQGKETLLYSITSTTVFGSTF